MSPSYIFPNAAVREAPTAIAKSSARIFNDLGNSFHSMRALTLSLHVPARADGGVESFFQNRKMPALPFTLNEQPTEKPLDQPAGDVYD